MSSSPRVPPPGHPPPGHGGTPLGQAPDLPPPPPAGWVWKFVPVYWAWVLVSEAPPPIDPPPPIEGPVPP